jgi:superoxide dismutase, Cu-Zn family
MRPSLLTLAVVFVSVAAFAAPAKPGAKTELKDAAGKVVGKATFQDAKDGVKVSLQVMGLKPGKHGVHIHSMGKCEAPDFKTAGGHFNPDSKHHGHKNPQGPHVGDLGNLTVDKNGKGHLTADAKGASLTEGNGSLLVAPGTALVIHADADDEMSDPSGNSGARIACGVVEKE